MNNATAPVTTAFGRHMKQWRKQRGLSQLELASRANVSQRHISFIETGRSRPKVNVVHKVAEALDIPVRERNTMLEAAGLAPSYPELPLSNEAAAPFRDAVRRMLGTHEPFPAYVVDRWWDVVDANEAGRRLFPQIEDGPANTVDTLLGPGPFRQMIENYSAVAWTFLIRMRREVADAGPDPRLQDLLERAEHYMKDVPPSDEDIGTDLVVCPRLRLGDQVVKTISMMARFGSAREVNLDELRVELIYPGDSEAEAYFMSGA